MITSLSHTLTVSRSCRWRPMKWSSSHLSARWTEPFRCRPSRSTMTDQHLKVMEIWFFSALLSRQVLSFVEIQKAPVVAGSAHYVDSGSLRYEFPRELFQTPLQLIKIVELQKQVSLHISQKKTKNNLNLYSFFFIIMIVFRLGRFLITWSPTMWIESVRTHLRSFWNWSSFFVQPAFRTWNQSGPRETKMLTGDLNTIFKTYTCWSNQSCFYL